jgi:NADP-dependent 3-hydroxy acid dehydrogenase YdfG
MPNTIVVCGYGPGISAAVARKFGAQGYQVALVGRTAARVEAGAASLREAGVQAKAFTCDLGDPAAVTQMLDAVREQLGPVHTLYWNAYGNGAGDLLTCDPTELRAVFDVAVVGLVAAVQRSLADLKANKGAVLITGGGFAYYEDGPTKMANEYNLMGTALGKAAQHKATVSLHHKLADTGVFVGELVVLGLVKGTALSADYGMDADLVADAAWKLAQERNEVFVRVVPPT